MTIVTYHKPKRVRKPKVAQAFPVGRIVTASKPKKRPYYELREGVPDEGQRAKLIADFLARSR